MADDYIPRTDAEFDAWFATFAAWVEANGAAHGLTGADEAAVGAAKTDWSAKFAAHGTAQTAAETAATAKTTSRGSAEGVIRPVARKLQSASTMTDALRTAAGLTVRDATRSPAPVPTTRPLAMVDTSQRLRHMIHFKDELTPNSKKKPEGVMGAEIWCALGPTPPPDASTCSFVALDTGTPYLVEYEGEDANKIAHYLLRWVNTRGQKGPWSETVSATIGA